MLSIKGFCNCPQLSNIRELKCKKLETGVCNYFLVIFCFLKSKSAIFTYLFPQIIVSKLISKNFACFSLKIVGVIEANSKKAIELASETSEILL